MSTLDRIFIFLYSSERFNFATALYRFHRVYLSVRLFLNTGLTSETMKTAFDVSSCKGKQRVEELVGQFFSRINRVRCKTIIVYV